MKKATSTAKKAPTLDSLKKTMKETALWAEPTAKSVSLVINVGDHLPRVVLPLELKKDDAASAG